MLFWALFVLAIILLAKVEGLDNINDNSLGDTDSLRDLRQPQGEEHANFADDEGEYSPEI